MQESSTDEPANVRKTTRWLAGMVGFGLGSGCMNETPPVAHGLFGLLVLFGVLSAGADWDFSHGVMFCGAGGLMLIFRPVHRLPGHWWWLAAAFVVLAGLAFLPAAWFGVPAWRRGLDDLHLDTGPLQVIEPRPAAEMLGVYAITLGGGLWLAGQRVGERFQRIHTLCFVLGVAGYAVLAALLRDHGHPDQFGMFPNRNHTATLLAMGAVCGAGCLMQAIRTRKWLHLAPAAVGTVVCLWALLAWSVSRAGLLLVTLGGLAWLACLGRRYLGRHGGRALILVPLAAVGLFLIADSRLKERLATGAAKLAATEVSDQGWADKTTIEQLAAVEFRVPVWRDTLSMIAAAPWSGVGAGQFAGVFPQYRNHSAQQNHADCLHPESDWLWLAAETGLPATLTLLVLVASAGWRSLGSVVRGHSRAVRAACLVAALLVAAHGMFDVPGHRVPLAWAAALLFSLSLRPSIEDGVDRRPVAWPFRCAGAVVLAAGLWLLAAAHSRVEPPAFLAGATARHQAMQLYSQDHAQQLAAEAAGTKYQPATQADPLERALNLVERALGYALLDRQLWHLRGYLALHFDDKQNLVAPSFAIARALDPTWVGGPLIQARAAASSDPTLAAALCAEALARARQLDQRHPDTPWSEAKTLARVRQLAAGNPPLAQAWRKRGGTMPPDEPDQPKE
jgi:O-antigen ligase